MNKLINCKACQKEIAKGVKKCPGCGADQRNFFGKHKILTFIAVLIILGAIGSMGGDKDINTVATDNNNSNVATVEGATVPVKQGATEVATVATTEAVKTPIVLTTDDLIDELKSNALKASTTYKGQYVEVTGKLSAIDSDGKYFSITSLTDPYSFTSITCNISKQHLDAVMDFEAKQDVTVIGTITAVGEFLGYTIDVETIK